MALMGSSQTPQGQMVPGGGGRQGTYASPGAGSQSMAGLSKALAALAMNKQMQNNQTNQAQQQVSQAAQPGGSIDRMSNQAMNQYMQQNPVKPLQFDDQGNLIGGGDMGAMADME